VCALGRAPPSRNWDTFQPKDHAERIALMIEMVRASARGR
jgi:hypothetical protein